MEGALYYLHTLKFHPNCCILQVCYSDLILKMCLCNSMTNTRYMQQIYIFYIRHLTATHVQGLRGATELLLIIDSLAWWDEFQESRDWSTFPSECFDKENFVEIVNEASQSLVSGTWFFFMSNICG